MQSYTRHQLKQDKFATATKEAVHWSVEHRTTLTIGILLLAAILIGYGSWAYYTTEQDQQASLALTVAMRTYDAQISAPDQPVNPDVKTYPSITERSRAAHEQFLKIANDYPRTKNGKYARYMAGVTAMQSGDLAKAEPLLKESAGYSKDVAALSKYALASLYQTQGKEADAIRMYQDVIAADAATVPKPVAQIELAELYTAKQPAEAAKVYAEIIKQEQEAHKAAGGAKPAANPLAQPEKSPLEELATRKMEALKKKF